MSERSGPAVTRTKGANIDGCRRISVYFWILGVKLYEKRAYLLRESKMSTRFRSAQTGDPLPPSGH